MGLGVAARWAYEGGKEDVVTSTGVVALQHPPLAHVRAHKRKNPYKEVR